MIPLILGASDQSLSDNARMFQWGNNTNGNLGDGTTTNRSSPVQIGALTTWVASSAGGFANAGGMSYAMKNDGTIWAWGKNNVGQLAQGGTTYTSSPVQIGSLTTWTYLGHGIRSYHGAGIISGSLYTWGDGTQGALGHGNSTTLSSPVQVGSLTTWSKVALGNGWTCAVKTDGTMWCWGTGGSGQLGTGSTTATSSPVQVGSLTTWADVVCGSQGVMGLKTDGTIWTWGSGSYGQLGNNQASSVSSPVQVGGLTTWAKLGTGPDTRAAIKTDDTLWCWGYNANGYCGDATTTVRSSPVQVAGAVSSWSSVGIGEGGIFAISENKAYAWGRGSANGQLGHGNSLDVSSPVQIGALTTWRDVGTTYGGRRVSIA